MDKLLNCFIVELFRGLGGYCFVGAVGYCLFICVLWLFQRINFKLSLRLSAQQSAQIREPFFHCSFFIVHCHKLQTIKSPTNSCSLFFSSSVASAKEDCHCQLLTDNTQTQTSDPRALPGACPTRRYLHRHPGSTI